MDDKTLFDRFWSASLKHLEGLLYLWFSAVFIYLWVDAGSFGTALLGLFVFLLPAGCLFVGTMGIVLAAVFAASVSIDCLARCHNK